jgi:hypothetical protein
MVLLSERSNRTRSLAYLAQFLPGIMAQLGELREFRRFLGPDLRGFEPLTPCLQSSERKFILLARLASGIR